jgi:hypothetical protein
MRNSRFFSRSFQTIIFADSFAIVILKKFLSYALNSKISAGIRLSGGEKPIRIQYRLLDLYSNLSSYNYIDGRDGISVGKTFQQQNIIEIRNIKLDTKTGIAYSGKNEYIADSSAWPIDYLVRTSQVKPPSTLTFRMNKFGEGSNICLSSNGFYHWLIEDLPHFLFLYENLKNPRVIVFENAPSYVLALLEKLQVKYVKASRFVSLDEYYFIGREDSVGWPHPRDLSILKSFSKDIAKAKVEGKKIYISRVGASRSPKFESELISGLRDKGWVIIDTTFMPFIEQIELLSSASVLAGVHGAGLSGMTWLESSSKVIELTNNRLVRCFERLALLLNLDYIQIRYESNQVELSVPELLSKMEEFSS